mmetsp:Transcript_7090/g.17805  ORF Transcript_7090/g.17805 Transcript_7090/m.17805 type:complete len:203 (-) Transcript_7090:452-1060(-)
MTEWSPFYCLPRADLTPSGLIQLDTADHEVLLLRRSGVEFRHMGPTPMAPRPRGLPANEHWKNRTGFETVLTITTHRFLLLHHNNNTNNSMPTNHAIDGTTTSNNNNNNNNNNKSKANKPTIEVVTVITTDGTILQLPVACAPGMSNSDRERRRRERRARQKQYQCMLDSPSSHSDNGQNRNRNRSRNSGLNNSRDGFYVFR